jgi:hypothetical protein
MRLGLDHSYDGQMVEEIVVGLVVTAAGGLVVRMTGIFRAPRNVRACEVEVNRAKTDYGASRQRIARDFAEKVRQIDEDHNSRGTYHSGERVYALKRAAEDAQLETVADLRHASRRITDAFERLGRIDRVWVTIKDRKALGYGGLKVFKAVWIVLTKKTLSLEDDVLEPVLRDLKAQTED